MKLKLSCIAMSAPLSFGNVMCSQDNDYLNHSLGLSSYSSDNQPSIRETLRERIQKIDLLIENEPENIQENEKNQLKIIAEITKTFQNLQALLNTNDETESLIKSLAEQLIRPQIDIHTTNEISAQILIKFLQSNQQEIQTKIRLDRLNTLQNFNEHRTQQNINLIFLGDINYIIKLYD